MKTNTFKLMVNIMKNKVQLHFDLNICKIINNCEEIDNCQEINT